MASSAQATALNVLWYTYADPASEYRASIALLADTVQTLPYSAGQGWNLTYFDPGSVTPDFSAYDVLVIESGEAFRTGAPGAALATPNYAGILGNRALIAAARGERTFITSSDADFHAVRGNTGNTALHTCALAIATSADAAVPVAQQLAVPIDAPGTLLLLASPARSSAAARDAIGTLSTLE